MKKNLIYLILTITIFIISTIVAIAQNDNTKTFQIPLQNGIKIMINDTIYITNNDSVCCISKIEGQLISKINNEFIYKNIKIPNNHPNYGFFQDAAERYFNDVLLIYIRTPKSISLNDKQNDINQYGIPTKRDVIIQSNGKFNITLTWNNIKNTYNEYGKRIIQEE